MADVPHDPRVAPMPAKTALKDKRPMAHAHRTAKVVELVCSSPHGFEDAIRNALADASASTRGITGAHVLNMSIRCEDGKPVEYKVDLKVAFGIERTPSA